MKNGFWFQGIDSGQGRKIQACDSPGLSTQKRPCPGAKASNAKRRRGIQAKARVWTAWQSKKDDEVQAKKLYKARKGFFKALNLLQGSLGKKKGKL